MKKLILIAVLLCSSCAQTPVPVAYQCPVIVLPPEPTNYVKNLNAKSTPDDVMKAWVATATSYKGWNKVVTNQVLNSN